MAYVKRISQDTQSDGDIKCEVHKPLILNCFCKSCDVLVCMDCILNLHKSHDWCKVSDIVTIKKYELSENLRQIQRDHLRLLSASISNTKRATNDISDQLARIDAQGDKIISIVRDIQEKLKQNCRDKVKLSRNAVGKAESDKIYLESVRRICAEKSKSGSDAEIILANRNLKMAMDEYSPDNFRKQMVSWSFEQGNIDKDLLADMFGRFTPKESIYEKTPLKRPVDVKTPRSAHRPRDQEMDFKITFDVISIFRHGIFDIQSICPIAEKAWIHQREGHTNALVDKDGEVIKKLNFHFIVNSFSKTRDGTLFCADFRNKSIYRVISSDGSIVKLFETKKLRPTSVSLTHDGHLLVSLVDKFEFILSRQSQRKISKMKMDGIEVQVYGTENLFTAPRKAVENGNRDICVIDVLGENKGRLCVLDSDGRLKFIYKEYNKKAPLWDRWVVDISAWDVCCDDRHRIIVSGCQSREVRFIDSYGKLLEKFVTTGHGLDKHPICLGVDHYTLWLGFEEGHVMVFKYDQ
ncbi:uncharacterized protein LOC133182667 [Saccostrea echinata]|uniref:uncharacterized protein LOC133182667 n=1 Tax=Saccostrea echinata TaxID=191078 RepID=UPI002A83184A|nr:uncharacterized protein LOC133182667 [Saccostrea echinata]